MFKFKRQYNLYLRQLKNLKGSFMKHYLCDEEDLIPMNYFDFEVIWLSLEHMKMKQDFKTLRIIELQINHKDELEQLIK